MTFTSFQFGIFVAVVFGAYYLPPLRPFQVQLLVLASLVFYGSGQPELLPLLLVAVLGTYLCLVLAFDNRALWMPAGIVFNLALLAFFKYKLLFIDPAALHPTGVVPLDVLLRLPLPIGISFFVFHNISLLVDLTREKQPPRLRDVFLYIIFFPQLVSGPITRAGQFMPQIVPKQLGDVDLVAAAKWILTGFFFKLYVANNLNEMTSYMDYPLYETVATPDRWLLVFLYSYQIYADFFGYSAIALGLGLLFGYRLPVNFDLPYISVSFSEFWTRWHISLSTWLKTYLYIPLGETGRAGPDLPQSDDRDDARRTLARREPELRLMGHAARPAARPRAAASGAARRSRACGAGRPPGRGVFLRDDAVDLLQAAKPRSRARLSLRHVRADGQSQSDKTVPQHGAALRPARPDPAPRHRRAPGGQIAAMGAVSLRHAGGDGLARGRAGRRLHLFPVLTMPQSSGLSWLIKCAGVAAVLLLACSLVTARFGSALQQPTVTTRDGTTITLNRYIGEPVPDLVLVGSSVAWRLKEEYFSRPRARNLALAGGSPVTSLDIVARQKSLPKIVLIETNVLTRLPDHALIAKFRRRAHRSLVPAPGADGGCGLRDVESHAAERCGRARRAGSAAQRAAEPIRQQGLSRPCRAADE
ncbi:MBOAT family O-acyltransferase [Bradyrhizobium sp. RDM12]